MRNILLNFLFIYLDIAAKSFDLKPLTRFTELKILGLHNSKITAPNDKF